MLIRQVGERAEAEMRRLGFDNVWFDRMGNVVLGARYIRKDLKRTIEDVGVTVPGVGTQYYMANPGEGITLTLNDLFSWTGGPLTGVGNISADGDMTVRGGTGWGAEFAKICNKPLHVFDQAQDAWFKWTGTSWKKLAASDGPVITHVHVTGTGTRLLQDNGRRAIEELFDRSF